jgi:PAS domain S-box-containing protein
MALRTSALAQILESPTRILAIVLAVVFSVEVAVMLILPYIVPRFVGETGKALLDAILLTTLCAPALWWIIIGPLRRIAVQEHARSETIVANAGEGILTFERNGTIISCNRAGAMLFGSLSNQLVGQPIWSVIPGLPLTFDSAPYSSHHDGSWLDGSTIPLQVSISEVPSKDHSLLIAVVRDLTQTHKAQQERIDAARQAEALKAQQMTTLAQLATGVAHEIRNPLTSIKMLIQVNRAKFAEMGLPTEDIQLVEQEIRRMERSVTSLLEYARPEKTEFREFLLRETIDTTLRLVNGRCVANHVELKAELPETPIKLYGDSAQIQQLLLNLCLNGLDAMPNGGVLRIRVTTSDSLVKIVVSDTGPGIREDVMGSLFSPFVTTKRNGVGLGLGICRRIAESHQGSLTGANSAEGGARFDLTLPMSRGSELRGDRV